ncbi:unnamed protein product [Chondrus crispus]|uniref:Uncharacterized protein n=1 Tax=Chondrus crispus TaxID=2769 RepID=R7QRX0_CHOCR|nr:unnamed protein product [Chondrus crispus]CDF41242.1 unnamed protein product [Chondrus crispus]|eukprot:XP_005711536.1 unnamed protein product [Chondrus crispus]
MAGRGIRDIDGNGGGSIVISSISRRKNAAHRLQLITATVQVRRYSIRATPYPFCNCTYVSRKYATHPSVVVCNLCPAFFCSP